MATRVFTNPKGGGGSASIDAVAFYAAIAGGTYLTYTLSLQGSLGASAKQVAQQVQRAFGGGKLPNVGTGTGHGAGSPTSPPAAGTTPPVSSAPGVSPDSTQWLPEKNNPGWYWDVSGRNPGWMFHWGTDVNNDANWYDGGLDNLIAQYGHVGGA